MERSLNEQLDGVRDAFYRFGMTLTPAMPMDSMGGFFVEDVFQDYLIAEIGNKYYRVGYAVNGEAYTFDPQAQWQEVEETWIVKTLGKTIAELKVGRRNSGRDQQRLQQIHDYAVENGAMCKSVRKSSFIEDGSNCLKTISKTDDEWRIANYMLLFGGRDLTSFSGRSIRPNPDGSLGEFFSERTDYESDYTQTKTLYVDFEHSIDPDGIGIGQDDILGYVDMKTAKKDKRGLFVERVLNRRNDYVKWLEELHDAGFTFGNSSEAITGKTQRAENGEILKWALKRDTITFNPMESRMLGDNHLQAVKGLAEVFPELKSWIASNVQPSGAEPTSKAEDETKTVQINEVDMEKEDFKALLEENNKSIEAKAKEAAKAAVTEVLDGLPEVKARMGAQTHVTVDEADHPFKSVAEQMLAIKNLNNGRIDPRMKRIQAISRQWMEGNDEKKALLGSNETIPSQGEFLLEPTISAEFLKPIHDQGPLSSLARRMPVGPNSNFGWINGVDETARTTGNRWGGVRGYWLSEGDALTASQPKFKRINWELHELGVLQYCTDNMLKDSVLMDSVIRESSLEELNFMVNDSFFRGTGAGQPKGFGVTANSALISATRTNATNIDHDDILRMKMRMSPKAYSRMVWLANPDVMGELDSLTFTSGSTGILSPYVKYDNNGVMNIAGRPVVFNEFCPTLGAVGDLLLWDPQDYLYWEGAGVEGASSIHVQFLTNQTVFRFIYRIDGMPASPSAITPYQGSNTTSPYIALAATT